MKTELGLERSYQDPRRQAAALVAAMTVSVEELDPRYLKGYGPVPESLALYLDTRINTLLQTLNRIGNTLGKTVSVVRPEG